MEGLAEKEIKRGMIYFQLIYQGEKEMDELEKYIEGGGGGRKRVSEFLSCTLYFKLYVKSPIYRQGIYP